MLDMTLEVLREQGILILMGMLLAGGIFGQVMASVRFRKLRKGIQALVSLKSPEISRKQETEDSPWEDFSEPKETGAQNSVTSQREAAVQENGNRQADGAEGADSQLLYLKQSLDRIAAGRDEKLTEEPKGHRKLTPAEEQIIVDILKEYLS